MFFSCFLVMSFNCMSFFPFLPEARKINGDCFLLIPNLSASSCNIIFCFYSFFHMFNYRGNYLNLLNIYIHHNQYTINELSSKFAINPNKTCFWSSCIYFACRAIRPIACKLFNLPWNFIIISISSNPM